MTGGGAPLYAGPSPQLEETLKITCWPCMILPRIYDARNMLELTTIRFAASKRTQDIRELKELIERESLWIIELFTSLDRDFHELIAKSI